MLPLMWKTKQEMEKTRSSRNFAGTAQNWVQVLCIFSFISAVSTLSSKGLAEKYL